MFYENLAWFTVLWICALVARRLWRAAHSPAPVAVSLPKRKTPRPLKPCTPNDCPVCGRPHPTPIAGNVRKPDVLPGSERKSARGKPKTIGTAGYACPYPDCDYFGNTDPAFHALVLLAVNLGLAIADVQLLFGHSEVTIRLWLSCAGQHAERVHAHFFRNLVIGHLRRSNWTHNACATFRSAISVSLLS